MKPHFCLLRTDYFFTAPDYLHDNSSETLITIIKEIEKIQVTKINGVYVKKYALTSKQRKILQALNINEDKIDGYIKMLNEANI